MLVANSNINNIGYSKILSHEISRIKEFCNKFSLKFVDMCPGYEEMLKYNMSEFPIMYYNLSNNINEDVKRFCRYLELNNVKCVNPIYKQQIACDKILCHLELKNSNVPIVRTISLGTINNNPIEIHINRIEKEIGYPCVIKPVNGSLGIGVVKCDDKNILSDILNLIFSTESIKYGGINSNNFIIQKYIEPLNGNKLRLVFYNDCALITYKHYSDNWKVNTLTSKTATLVEPSTDLLEMAKKIHKILGINFSSMDFHITENGYMLNEVNCSPRTVFPESLTDYKVNIFEFIFKDTLGL